MAKAIRKEKGLGRGLSAILNDPSNDIRSISDKNADRVVGQIIEVPLSSIEVNPFQPRTSFNEESLHELASSVKELGVIQPITVRKVGFNKYQLISGERRFRASKLVGLETIPAYIRIANDQESLEMALVENIQRHDLDPIEIALSYQRLIEEIKLTQEQMSQRVGKKRSTITNYLRLLNLDPIVQTGIRDGFISMGHGKALATLEKKTHQIQVYKKAVSEKWSVRQTEQYVSKLQDGDFQRATSSSERNNSTSYNSQVDEFRKRLNANVVVKIGKAGKGSIQIPFRSQEDFERIQKIILGEK